MDKINPAPRLPMTSPSPPPPPCAFGPSINNLFAHSARHNLRYLSPLRGSIRGRPSAEFTVPKSVRCAEPFPPPSLAEPSIRHKCAPVSAETENLFWLQRRERLRIWNVPSLVELTYNNLLIVIVANLLFNARLPFLQFRTRNRVRFSR